MGHHVPDTRPKFLAAALPDVPTDTIHLFVPARH